MVESTADIVPQPPIISMRCVCCGATDKWKNVDEHRIIPKGMSICMGCGFVSYPSLYKSEEEIKAHYRTDYRAIPKAANLFTCVRKNHMHDAFLGKELRELKKRKENPVVGEIGAAYGVFLNHIREQYFPKGEFYGTELTTTYRRVAFHEYGLNLTEDFDFSKKYDLIISYKVAEHQLDIDQKLRQYAEALAEGGLMYISVPTWFGTMTNFGIPGFDLEYYYDTNHINAWTRQLFETVLKKAGLEVVKFDDKMYDSTYLCKRNDAVMKMEHPGLEDPDDIMRRMKAIKEAFLAMKNNDPEAAIAAYPNYPEAWAYRYEKGRAELHKDHQDVTIEMLIEQFYKPFKEACGDTYDTNRFMADIAMRYDQYELALEYWQKCIIMRPGSASVLMPITQCYRRLAEISKDPKFSEALRRKSAEITRHWLSADYESRNEALTWLYFDLSKIKLPSEV
jgi:SAM-dependent methyltransferase